MGQAKMIVTLAVVLVVGIAVQVMLVHADAKDTPSRAATAFTKAYFKLDRAGMYDRICESTKGGEESDPVGDYVYQKTREANARGFDVGIYVKECLYHLKAETVERNGDSVKVRVTADRKSPLRTFFSKGDIHHVDEVLELVKEDGQWKVCGAPFAIPGA